MKITFSKSLILVGIFAALAAKAHASTDCSQAAIDIAIKDMENGGAKIDRSVSCEKGGLCIEAKLTQEFYDTYQIYRVSGEYMSGAFAYDAAIDLSNGRCDVVNLVPVYSD